MAAAAKTAAKGGGLTRKLGPLPVWAWAAVGVVGILVVYSIYKKRQQGAAQAAAPAATDTLGTSPQDNGLAGAGLTTGSASSTPDLTPLLDQTTGLIQSQQGLIAELANGAYTVSMNTANQLGSLAAGDQGLLAQLASGYGSAATAPAMVSGSSGGSPAYTAAPSIEANLGAIAAGNRSAVSNSTPIQVGATIDHQQVYRQAQGVNVINAPGGAGGRMVVN